MKLNIPSIPENERTPLIDILLEIIQQQAQRISNLENEIQELKKETKRPVFKSSKMDKKTEVQKPKNKKKKLRQKKKQNLEVHDEKIIHPDAIPEDARKGIEILSYKIL